MGARGALAEPAPIKKLKGTWRADRHAQGVEAPVERPTCPAFLSRQAKAEWKRQIGQLERLGCIALLDRAMLASYCEAWGEFVKAAEAIEKQGCLIKGPEGTIVEHPMVKIRDRARAALIKGAVHFGFSPAARMRVRASNWREEGSGNGEGPTLFKIRS